MKFSLPPLNLSDYVTLGSIAKYGVVPPCSVDILQSDGEVIKALGHVLASRSPVLKEMIRNDTTLVFNDFYQDKNYDNLLTCIDLLHGGDMELDMESLKPVYKFGYVYKVEDMCSGVVEWITTSITSPLQFWTVFQMLSEYYKFLTPALTEAASSFLDEDCWEFFNSVTQFIISSFNSSEINLAIEFLSSEIPCMYKNMVSLTIINNGVLIKIHDTTLLRSLHILSLSFLEESIVTNVKTLDFLVEYLKSKLQDGSELKKLVSILQTIRFLKPRPNFNQLSTELVEYMKEHATLADAIELVHSSDLSIYIVSELLTECRTRIVDTHGQIEEYLSALLSQKGSWIYARSALYHFRSYSQESSGSVENAITTEYKIEKNNRQGCIWSLVKRLQSKSGTSTKIKRIKMADLIEGINTNGLWCSLHFKDNCPSYRISFKPGNLPSISAHNYLNMDVDSPKHWYIDYLSSLNEKGNIFSFITGTKSELERILTHAIHADLCYAI